MSLKLDRGTLPAGVEVKTFDDRSVFLRAPGAAMIEVSMRDFCGTVIYVLTNTDLGPDDPRRELLARLSYVVPQASPNAGKERLAPIPDF